MIGANDVAGGLSKGLRSFFKHFAANDQETNRHGISTFANEQALREVYFKQFQHVVQTGKAITLMEAFNRVGCTWAGGNYALCTQLLRDESSETAVVCLIVLLLLCGRGLCLPDSPDLYGDQCHRRYRRNQL